MNRMLLMTLAVGSGAAGCSQAPARVNWERQPLPFVVKLKKTDLKDVEKEIASNPNLTVPANYGDPDELTRELARALRERGTFEVVVTDDDQDVAGLAPDLEMEVLVKGNDFGPGEPKIAMSIFSTVTWLFAGHLSWLIRDRAYPNSEVKLTVVIRKPAAQVSPAEGAGRGQETPPIFAETFFLKDLDLNFSERAQRKNWLREVEVQVLEEESLGPGPQLLGAS